MDRVAQLNLFSFLHIYRPIQQRGVNHPRFHRQRIRDALIARGEAKEFLEILRMKKTHRDRLQAVPPEICSADGQDCWLPLTCPLS